MSYRGHWSAEKAVVIREAPKEAGYGYYFDPGEDIFSCTVELLAQDEQNFNGKNIRLWVIANLFIALTFYFK